MNELITRHELDFFTILAMSALSEATKRKYGAAIKTYQATGASLTDFDALAAHAATLTPAMRGHFKSGLKFWCKSLEKRLKAMARPELVLEFQAIFWRLESLSDAVEAPQARGEKVHSWLNAAEVKQLLATCNLTELQGRRNKVVLATLAGAGLRREELVTLDFEDRALIPSKDRFRTVLNVRGKGAKDRAIPISEPLAALLDEWRAEAGPGKVARAINNRNEIQDSLSLVGVFLIVKEAGAAMGRPKLAPHDLRRSYAQIGFNNGISVPQLSKLLGHNSLETTMRYLRLDLDMMITASDFVPIE